jgi:hypothetical protein
MRSTAFMVVLSIAMLSTVALAGHDDVATVNNQMPRDSKAAVPGLINYQGTLTDSNGVALNTIVSITFSIYTDSTGGVQVWTETQPLVEVNNGLFNVLLGKVNTIPDTVFNGVSRWLGVQVESDPELEPRQRMAAVGYAFRAFVADTADFARAPAPSDGDWTISGNYIYSAVPGSVGIGITDPVAKLHVVDGSIAVSDAGDATGIKIAESWITDPYDGALHIQSGGDVVTFDGSDNVGIGTAVPSAKLDVSGDINADSLYKIKGTTVLSTPGFSTHLGAGAGANATGNVTLVGYNAGYSDSGIGCTSVGAHAGYSNAGSGNTFIGNSAGGSNTSGDYNTFVGYGAGYPNTTGSSNTIIGSGAGNSTTSGTYNTFLGATSGNQNTTGQYNTFLGSGTGFQNETGIGNTCVGVGTGGSDTSNCNTALGTWAGTQNQGSNNVFLGYGAGFYETGSNKLYIANAADTGSVLIYGDFSTGNVGIGTLSPASMLDVSGDINADSLYKIGGNAVLSVSSPRNTLVGVGAGANNTGDYGTFVGYNAGHNNQSSCNTFLGEGAGFSNTTGYNNTFLGKGAGAYNDTGSANTFVGRDAGYQNSAGSGNVFVGYEAGYYEGGSNKLYIANGPDTNDVLIYGDFSTGNVGIGTLSPEVNLEVNAFGSDWRALLVEHSSRGNVAYIGDYNVGVYGHGDSVDGVYGSTNSSIGHAVGGHHLVSDNRGYIGGASYAMYADLASTELGNYAIYGYGTDAPGEDGTGYGDTLTLGGVKGYNYYGNPYTFGVAGYSDLDYNRSGGCFGGKNNGTVWGSMGYRTSGGAEYGGYFTSYTFGTGKSMLGKPTSVGIGLGSWGELFGADIHGKVYGAYVEGGNYALYSNGAVFKNDVDVHLQDIDSRSMAVLYTNVSTDVTVQTSGFSMLSKGTCHIEFDAGFKKVVSPDVPIVVTVTPTGNCNGVHVSEVTKGGFTVMENNGGKSNVKIAFIAVGRRAGYERPQLPEEVILADYVKKLSRGLHNDGDPNSDGEGLYFENGGLYVGVHPSTLPDPYKPLKKSEEAEDHRKLLEAEVRERLERERMEQ